MNIADFLDSLSPAVVLLLIAVFTFLVSFVFLMLSFFVVKVSGALEESDDTYELICVAFIKYHSGKWSVNLKDLFDENAALKLRFGWAFSSLFEEDTIEGIAAGLRCGAVSGVVKKETILLRRRIR